MNIKILSFTSILALLCVTSPLVLKAANEPADAAAYAQVWKDRADWTKFTPDQLLLFADILLEKAKDPNEKVQPPLKDVLYRIAITCSLEDCHAMDEKFCKFDIPNAVNYWPAFPKTAVTLTSDGFNGPCLKGLQSTLKPMVESMPMRKRW